MKKFIYIEWEDVIQFSRTGWKDQEDATKETKEESFIVQQVGWIVNQDENYIVLANLIKQDKEREQKREQDKEAKIYFQNLLKSLRRSSGLKKLSLYQKRE